MGEVRVSVITLLLLLAGPALAQDEGAEGGGNAYVQLLDQVKSAIAAKDYKSARGLLGQAEAAAASSEALVMEKDLARLPFYRGLVEWRDGDKDTAALNHWRDAITLSQSFEPEADVLPEAEGQDVYYALMGEVKAREAVTLGLPEDPGDTVIFVDGRRMEPFDAVLVGKHFIQMRCGEGNVVGSWYTFGPPPPDYLVLCSGGAYPAPKGKGGKPVKEKGPSKADIAKAEKEAAKKAAADKAAADKAAKEAAAAEKAAADKAAKDKATAQATDDKAAADKAAADKAAADKAAADKAAADKLNARPPKEPGDSGVAGWAMIGGGGAMIAGGFAVNFLVVNPAWTEAQAVVADPSTATRAEADAIVGRFNTGRYATIGLIAAGVATAGVGVFLGPLESKVVFTPNGVGLAGTW